MTDIVHRVKAPNGEILSIRGPSDATELELQTAASEHWNAKTANDALSKPDSFGKVLAESAGKFAHAAGYGLANVPLLPATVMKLAAHGADWVNSKLPSGTVPEGEKVADRFASGPEILGAMGVNPPEAPKTAGERVRQGAADALGGFGATRLMAPHLSGMLNAGSNLGGSAAGQVAGGVADDHPLAVIPAALAGATIPSALALRKSSLESFLQEGVDTLGERGLREAAARREAAAQQLRANGAQNPQIALSQGATQPSALDAVTAELSKSPATGGQVTANLNAQVAPAEAAGRGVVNSVAPGMVPDTGMAETVRNATARALDRWHQMANRSTTRLYNQVGATPIPDILRASYAQRLMQLPMSERLAVPGAAQQGPGAREAGSAAAELVRPEVMTPSEYARIVGPQPPIGPGFRRVEPPTPYPMLTPDTRPVQNKYRALATALQRSQAEGATAQEIQAAAGARPAMRELNDVLTQTTPAWRAAQDLQRRFLHQGDRVQQGPVGRMMPSGQDALDDPGKLQQMAWVFNSAEAGPRDVRTVARELNRTSGTLPGTPNAFEQLTKFELNRALQAATKSKAGVDAAQQAPEAILSSVFGNAASQRRANVETAIGEIARQRGADPNLAVAGFRDIANALQVVSRGREALGAISGDAIAATKVGTATALFPSVQRRALERFTQAGVYRQAMDAMFAPDGAARLVEIARNGNRNRVPEAVISLLTQPAIDIAKE